MALPTRCLAKFGTVSVSPELYSYTLLERHINKQEFIDIEQLVAWIKSIGNSITIYYRILKCTEARIWA